MGVLKVIALQKKRTLSHRYCIYCTANKEGPNFTGYTKEQLFTFCLMKKYKKQLPIQSPSRNFQVGAGREAVDQFFVPGAR